MKRIEYTAAGLRLFGIFLIASILAQSVEFQTVSPTRVVSSWRPALHFLGVPILDAQAGIVLIFLFKLAIGVALTLYPLRLGKLFWVGILPEIPGGIPRIGRKSQQNDYLAESEADTWGNPL